MTDPSIFWEHTARTGEVICQTCCESKPKDQMEPVSDEPGKIWDICKECSTIGREYGATF